MTLLSTGSPLEGDRASERRSDIPASRKGTASWKGVGTASWKGVGTALGRILGDSGAKSSQRVHTFSDRQDLPAPEAILSRFARACRRRAPWESLWRDCYAYTLPARDATLGNNEGHPDARAERLFDGTAPDAVDQLAASLLAELTPPWARWFGFAPGREIPAPLHPALAPKLDRAAEILQQHLDRSNFAVEIHQCFLDLAVAGTACLAVEEAAPGQASAFRFAAVPLGEIALEEGADHRLDIAFRRSRLSRLQVMAKFPEAEIPLAMDKDIQDDDAATFTVVEAVLPRANGGDYDYIAVLEGAVLEGMGHSYGVSPPSRLGQKKENISTPQILTAAQLEHSPFLAFRWMKAPGEAYGRSPVMKALPDIKTANKVVALMLKNAAIAVTGIWQADDDGVLNPATVKLVPGTIIPKAVGSTGLTPLQAPGNFSVSETTLANLRQSIRIALLTDRLATVAAPNMTATEILHRAAETARLLGATYGRLQAELLTPLVARTLAILRRRGELPDLALDGRTISLQYRSPLARRQAQMEAQSALSWLEVAKQLGPEATAILDAPRAARWAAEVLDVPAHVLRTEVPAPVPLADATSGDGLTTLATVSDPASFSTEGPSYD